MNISWFHEDLELVENSFDLKISLFLTLVRFITLIFAVIVHRAFYKLMKRLPGRAVNQIIFPYMVIYQYLNLSQSCFSSKLNIFSGDTLYIYGTLYNLSLISLLGLSIEGLHWRKWLLCFNILQRYWNLCHPTSFILSGHISIYLPFSFQLSSKIQHKPKC